MAKNKIIPTWIKLAALAALVVPYSVKTEKGENNKIKRVTARSVTANITYTAKDGDKDSELDVALFGAAKGCCGDKKVSVNKAAVRGDFAKLCDVATEKAKACAKKVSDGVSELRDKYLIVEEKADDAEVDDILDADDIDLMI